MLLPRCLKRHLFGFDGGDGCVFAERIAEGDDVGCVRSGREEKHFRGGVAVCRDEGVGETIGFFRAWRFQMTKTIKPILSRCRYFVDN